MTNRAPTCPYCGQPSKFVGGDAIYPHRPDLYSKRFYQCKPCEAYVGCHRDTDEPLGRLANAELRRAKMDAHSAFDPLWRNCPKDERKARRRKAYAWLTKTLGIPGEECHIGMFDVATCERVVEACTGISTLEEFNTGVPHQDLGPEQRQALWDACHQWVRKHKPRCPESLLQVDSINEALPELAEAVCELVGYHED